MTICINACEYCTEARSRHPYNVYDLYKKGALSIEPLAVDGDHRHLKNILVRFNPINQHHLYKKLQMMKRQG